MNLDILWGELRNLGIIVKYTDFSELESKVESEMFCDFNVTIEQLGTILKSSDFYFFAMTEPDNLVTIFFQ